MQNSIFRVALATKFKEEDIDRILLICSKTENLPVAIEILLGIYEEPIINKMAKDNTQYRNRVFVDYCPFSDKVTYKANRVKSDDAWFLKDDDAIETNIVYAGYYTSDAMKRANFKGSEEEFLKKYERKVWKETVNEKTEESTISLRNWRDAGIE